MSVLVAFVGWIVMRYARSHLDGEAREGRFHALMLATFAAVLLLIQSGSLAGLVLAFIGVGLGLRQLLHIIAHSLYKAHAFLSSGGAVQAVSGLRRPGPVAVPSLGAVLRSFALALALYFTVAALFTAVAGPKSALALALGTMLVLGVAYLVAQGLADAAPAAFTRRTVGASVAAAATYFAFQRAADALWGPSLPAPPTPGALEWALVILAVVSFGLVAFAQTMFPLWAHHPAAAGVRVHLANGFYLNAVLDRLIGGFRAAKSN